VWEKTGWGEKRAWGKKLFLGRKNKKVSVYPYPSEHSGNLWWAHPYITKEKGEIRKQPQVVRYSEKRTSGDDSKKNIRRDATQLQRVSCLQNGRGRGNTETSLSFGENRENQKQEHQDGYPSMWARTKYRKKRSKKKKEGRQYLETAKKI